jgi:hypothetical protein
MTHLPEPARLQSAAATLVALLVIAGTAAAGVDLEAEPIRYSKAAADNAVSRLETKIAAGKVALAHDQKFGYLKSLLQEFDVPVSSQVLVFSKTSFQRNRIDPRTPRALYFNDDVYIGYCRDGEVLEITAVDRNLGLVFYSLLQEEAEKPKFFRQGDACLICHASSQNQGLPGNIIRSVYADRDGLPILSAGTHRIDHRSPFADRWGGWYVTGTHGKQTHLGNLILRDRRARVDGQNKDGLNVVDLRGRVNTTHYLSGHSDIVALMVLEHQAEMQNLLTRANYLTRQAIFDQAAADAHFRNPAGGLSDLTRSRIRTAGEPVVKYMLFSEEAPLTDAVKGTSGFAEEYARRGPRDPRGRSLRDFDLTRRMFKHPCSSAIYSPLFDALPEPVKDYVLRRLWEVLSGKDASAEFAHLSPADRRAIREILRETKPNLPPEWK